MNRGGGTRRPAAEKPPSARFTLELGNLKATFSIMMEQIEATIKKMLEDEISKQPPHERMPLKVRGRLYTPAPENGVFLVRMVPEPSQGGGKVVVTLLIRWIDLYIMAFYVEGVWYCYKDFDTNMLPPQTQLRHNTDLGVGIIKLPLSSSYTSIGGYNIKVGKPSFTNCILTLGKLGELYHSQQGLKVLTSGPLSLPTITISEAIRFEIWRGWVVGRLDEEVDTAVPVEHSGLFNQWSNISDAVASNSSWRGRGVPELVKLVYVLMRSHHIKPDTAKAEGSSSRSKKKMIL